jgi:cytoskeletal protein CcmA (bactofilin family)
MRFGLLLSLSVLAFVPPVAQAETVVRTGESVVIATDQVVESDFYALAGTIVHTGQVVGDMYAVGGDVTAQGAVETDLTVIGGRVDVDGDVGDDLRVVGGETQIAGAIGGDVFVIGGMLTVLPSASIAGDIYFFGGEAEINGPVGGSVLGHAERLRIDTMVGNLVQVTARQGLTLGAQASVVGNVEYRSSRELVRAPDAVIGGELVSSPLPVIEDTFNLTERVLPLLVMLFGSLVLYLLGRSFMSAVVSQSLTYSVRASFIGVAIVFAGPLVAIFLLATVLGLVVGLSALGLLLVLLALSYSIAPMILGVLIWRLAGGASTLQPFAILLGVVVLQLALILPVVGVMLVFALSVIAAGALAEVSLRRLRGQ